MRFKKTKEEEPRLGITALIDIVFLLLIFFMLTSHFQISSGIPIILPKVTQKLYNSEQHKINIVIDRQGRTYLKGESINIKELGTQFQSLVKETGRVHLILEADKDVRHGRVVEVMDLAKRSGVSSIIIAAGWERKERGQNNFSK